jgi:peptidoglycan/xylan/chitin deacetylase (PgdA/CDA1 family)
MSCSSDRIQRLVSEHIAKGYMPVSLKDIAEHFKYGKSVPKRCFTFMFDDFRFVDYLNLKNRSAFTRNNIKASLAVISGQNDTIYYNGQPISIEKAVAIGKNAGFECYSHTRNHRYLTSIKPSEYKSEAYADIYDGDTKGINPNILIFPYGAFNTYLIDIFKFLGYEAGVATTAQDNCFFNNPYVLMRIDLGHDKTIESIIEKLL